MQFQKIQNTLNKALKKLSKKNYEEAVIKIGIIKIINFKNEIYKTYLIK